MPALMGGLLVGLGFVMAPCALMFSSIHQARPHQVSPVCPHTGSGAGNAVACTVPTL